MRNLQLGARVGAFCTNQHFKPSLMFEIKDGEGGTLSIFY
jgi:hypothetical protein